MRYSKLDISRRCHFCVMLELRISWRGDIIEARLKQTNTLSYLVLLNKIIDDLGNAVMVSYSRIFCLRCQEMTKTYICPPDMAGHIFSPRKKEVMFFTLIVSFPLGAMSIDPRVDFLPMSCIRETMTYLHLPG